MTTSTTDTKAVKAITVPAEVAEAVKKAGKLPVKEYESKSNHGIDYAKGEYVNHTDNLVKELAFSIRQMQPSPSYKVIAAALGLQCDHWAYTAVHAFGKGKEGWKARTGGASSKKVEEVGTVEVHAEDLADLAPKAKQSPAKAKVAPANSKVA